jgi:hypothetical protein
MKMQNLPVQYKGSGGEDRFYSMGDIPPPYGTEEERGLDCKIISEF